MSDFTLKIYQNLLQALILADYRFVTFEEYCNGIKSDKMVVLRHDVDLCAARSLATAEIEHKLGIKAVYYFRFVSQSNQPAIIHSIATLGHEIGYHYEDMAVCHGDATEALNHFLKWLTYFRDFYPVKTICMHGSPRSKYDGKDLWKIYKYRDYGIIGEPYFDTDFSDMFYITDTGRRWDGHKVSVRDKIPQYQDSWIEQGLIFHSTKDIINAITGSKFPKKVMITTHPQRWSDNTISNIKEWGIQNVKNVAKAIIIKFK